MNEELRGDPIEQQQAYRIRTFATTITFFTIFTNTHTYQTGNDGASTFTFLFSYDYNGG